jgi:hypothetical protein
MLVVHVVLATCSVTMSLRLIVVEACGTCLVGSTSPSFSVGFGTRSSQRYWGFDRVKHKVDGNLSEGGGV